MIKKIIAIVLLVAIVATMFVLTGCGSNIDADYDMGLVETRLADMDREVDHLEKVSYSAAVRWIEETDTLDEVLKQQELRVIEDARKNNTNVNYYATRYTTRNGWTIEVVEYTFEDSSGRRRARE